MAITDMFPIPKAHTDPKDVQVGPTEQREKMHKPLWAPTRWYFGNEALGKKVVGALGNILVKDKYHFGFLTKKRENSASISLAMPDTMF